MIYCVQSQYGEAKAKEMKAKQAALSMAKADFDINPNLIEVSERVPIKEEKPKDAIPDVEWWYVTKSILSSPF
jgi:U4/U6 small nuclear ribonucleoprotein PRP3